MAIGHAGRVLSRWLSVAVVVVVVAAGYAVSRVPVDRPVVPTALAALPSDTASASITDWAGVREAVGTDLDAAYRADLSSVSVLAGSAHAMSEQYGWSVHDLEWESYGQSDRGAGAVLQLSDEIDVDAVRSGLREVGYEEPSDDDGVWAAGNALVARTDPTLTPMLSFVVVREAARQVVISDRRPYVERMAQALSGAVASVADDRSVRSVGLELRDALVANVHVGGRGCELMGFGNASPADQQQARARVTAVGGVGRHAAVGLALTREQFVLAMAFDGPVEGEVAARAELARGEAVGQGGTFDERFTVREATRRDRTVVLEMEPAPDARQLLSDLGRGAFLPAVCG